jgi:hypothetical protein
MISRARNLERHLKVLKITLNFRCLYFLLTKITKDTDREPLWKPFEPEF